MTLGTQITNRLGGRPAGELTDDSIPALRPLSDEQLRALLYLVQSEGKRRGWGKWWWD